jgi:hypothetical protein
MHRVETRRFSIESGSRAKIGSRALLAALLALYTMASISYASPMVDGPLVCNIDGNNAPSSINPDPLNYCPAFGQWERLGSGLETETYIQTHYPNLRG